MRKQFLIAADLSDHWGDRIFQISLGVKPFSKFLFYMEKTLWVISSASISQYDHGESNESVKDGDKNLAG